MATDKGVEDAIKAFGEISKLDDSWIFWVVGKGDPVIVRQMKKLAKTLGIERKVKFWGFVDNQKKFELLSNAHVMINPSKKEGWGLVNIEANSMGTPVVGYDVPGVRDAVIDGKTGYLCKLSDTTALANAAISVCKSKEKYSKLSRYVVKWSKQFTWEKSTKKSLKLIQNLLSQ